MQPSGATGDNTHYVYLHYHAGDTVVFYVGKGHHRKYRHHCRAHDLKTRSRMWQRVHAKHGVRVEVLEDNMSEYAAFLLERTMIALIGRRDLGLGTLVNHTDGGEGVKGRKASPEECAMRAESQRRRRADPADRARTGAASKAAWAREGAKERRVAAQLERYKDPEAIRKQSEGTRKRYQDPAQRAERSRLTKEMWRDPAHRARVVESLRRHHQTNATIGGDGG